MQNFMDRLALQGEALQKNYNVLSRSKSLEELAQNFFHVLHENLLVMNAAIFFGDNTGGDWQLLFAGNNKPAANSVDVLSRDEEFCIVDVEHPEFMMCIKHRLMGNGSFGILLGAKRDNSPYMPFDIFVLQFFMQQLDSAYRFYAARRNEKRLIFDLNHRVVQLSSLIDAGIEVARLQEENHLLHLSLERVLGLTNAFRGLLRIKNGRHVLKKIFLPSSFKGKHLEQGTNCISTAFSFSHRKYTFYLFEKESREGIIPFNKTDQLLLEAIVRQVHVSLENNYLHQQSLEKERIEHEISVAGTIQKKLIPEILPSIEGYDLGGINIPYKFIGGDFYDCIPLKDGRFLFIMADVSGKGVPAALLVSTLHALVHAYLDSPFELTELVQRLNEMIFETAPSEKYITAFFAQLDPDSGMLETVNAGHNAPYLLRSGGQIEELKAAGIPLGFMRSPFPYKNAVTTIEPGERFLLYTDGVTEAMNAAEEEYDDVRGLKKFLRSQSKLSANDFVYTLLRDINDFTGETPQSDDITALYLLRE